MAEPRPRTQTSPDESLHPPDERLRLDLHTDASDPTAFAADVRAGFAETPYAIPSRWRYDDAGARLFDQLCYTPEYYVTRAESALLASVAPALIERCRPDALIELAAGASRSTRALLDALVRTAPQPVYAPLDLSEKMLRRSAFALLQRYPTLRIHAIVGDFERHLDALPREGRRMVALLGNTLGALEARACERFLGSLRRALTDGDTLLLGVDQEQDPAIIARAWNDAAGLASTFNRNVLGAINRQLGGGFRLELFDHVAVFDREAARIESRLRAREAHPVAIKRLDLDVNFDSGQTIRTGFSRRFSRASLEALLSGAGFKVERWDEDAAGSYALALATPA